MLSGAVVSLKLAGLICGETIPKTVRTLRLDPTVQKAPGREQRRKGAQRSRQLVFDLAERPRRRDHLAARQGQMTQDRRENDHRCFSSTVARGQGDVTAVRAQRLQRLPLLWVEAKAEDRFSELSVEKRLISRCRCHDGSRCCWRFVGGRSGAGNSAADSRVHRRASRGFPRW